MKRTWLVRSLWVVGAALVVLYVIGAVSRTIGWVGFGAGVIGSLLAWDPRRDVRDSPAEQDEAGPAPARHRLPASLPPLEQAASIPFRRAGRGLEICLIRKMTWSWGIPKGSIEAGETPEMTVHREALEEAGIRGRLVGSSIGTYEYLKRGTPCVVAVYLLEVHEEREVWRESGYRERRWFTLAEAMKMLSDHPVLSLFEHAAGVLGAGESP